MNVNVLISFITKYRKALRNIILMAVVAAIGEFWGPYDRLGFLWDEAVAIALAPVSTVRTVEYNPQITKLRTTTLKSNKFAWTSDTQATTKHRSYVVRDNDTVSKIARRFNSDKDIIKQENGLDKNYTIRPKQELIISSY